MLRDARTDGARKMGVKYTELAVEFSGYGWNI